MSFSWNSAVICLIRKLHMLVSVNLTRANNTLSVILGWKNVIVPLCTAVLIRIMALKSFKREFPVGTDSWCMASGSIEDTWQVSYLVLVWQVGLITNHSFIFAFSPAVYAVYSFLVQHYLALHCLLYWSLHSYHDFNWNPWGTRLLWQPATMRVA